jgi:hypothetical protein
MRPVISQLVAPVVEQILLPGVETTLYAETGAPPSELGAIQVIVERPDSAAVATAPVGSPGTVEGTAAFDASEAAPVPALLVAVTVNVYEVPLVSPLRTQVVRVVAVQVAPPGAAVTV